jgi:hypothetical protein
LHAASFPRRWRTSLTPPLEPELMISGRPHTNCVKTSAKTWQKTQSCFIRDSDSSPHLITSSLVDYMTSSVSHVDNVHWCCSLCTDVSVLTHRKGTCRVLLHVSAAWSWRQHHDSDPCAAVFIISFVSTVLLSLSHVADIVSWLLHVLTQACVYGLSYATKTIHNITFFNTPTAIANKFCSMCGGKEDPANII